MKNPTKSSVPRILIRWVVTRCAMRQFIPRCMQVSMQALTLGGLTALAACSTDIGSINIIPKTDLRPDWLSYSGHKEEFTLREAGAADLVGPEGQCAGGGQEKGGDPAGGTPPPGGISPH